MSKLLMNSGRIIDLTYPRPDDILIEDIAHHLARISRFNGATPEPYSVAQHSVYVSHLTCENWALEGLLHDATEAYLGDITSPLKYLLPDYRKLERQWWIAISNRFGLPLDLPLDVHAADMQAYVKERIELLPKLPFSEDPDYSVFNGVIVPSRPIGKAWGPAYAESKFIKRFYELAGRETIDS